MTTMFLLVTKTLTEYRKLWLYVQAEQLPMHFFLNSKKNILNGLKKRKCLMVLLCLMRN